MCVCIFRKRLILLCTEKAHLNDCFRYVTAYTVFLLCTNDWCKGRRPTVRGEYARVNLLKNNNLMRQTRQTGRKSLINVVHGHNVILIISPCCCCHRHPYHLLLLTKFAKPFSTLTGRRQFSFDSLASYSFAPRDDKSRIFDKMSTITLPLTWFYTQLLLFFKHYVHHSHTHILLKF